MTDNKGSAGGGGISFLGLLGIIFITLKLCGVIEWSWWLVLLPLYGPFAVVVALALLFFGGWSVAWLAMYAAESLLQLRGKR